MIFNLKKPLPVADVEPDEPTMYLYGHEADKTVSYNGVVLPELPVWDKTAYPYAVIKYVESDNIVSGSHYAHLYLCKNPVTAIYHYYTGTMKTKKLQITGDFLDYGMVSDEKMLERVTEGIDLFLGSLAYLSEPNKWESVTEGTDKTDTDYSKYIWANHDIILAENDNEIVISATDPVTTYENADVTINGVGYVGAVLPKLPTWDKESYPYATIQITFGGSTCTLVFSSVPLAYKYERVGAIYHHCLYATETEYLAVGYSCASWDKPDTWDGTPWVAEELSGYGTSVTSSMNQKGIWANYDITNYENGSLYQATYDPIPIYE